MADLLPCPMCGKSVACVTSASDMWPEHEDEGNDDSYAVMCDAGMPDGPGGCGASGGFAPTKQEAAEAWNRRAPAQAAAQVPMTDAQVDQLADSILTDNPLTWQRRLARAIEAHHGIGAKERGNDRSQPGI